MKKKVMWLITGSILIFNGCKGDDINVSYVNNETLSSGATKENQQDSKGDAGTSWDYKDINGKKLYDQISTEKDGKSYSVTLDAEILCDYDLNNLSVYEYQYLRGISEDKKEKIVNGIFDGSEVYHFEEKYLPKEYYDVKIAECTADIEFIEAEKEKYENDPNSSFSDEGLQYLLKEREDYEEMYKNAPNDWVKIDDYSGYSYLGYIDGHPYSLEFRFPDILQDLVDGNVCPKDENNNYHLTPGIILSYAEHLDKTGYDEGQLTAEEADKIANTYIEKMLLDNVEPVELIDRPGVIYTDIDIRRGFVQGKADFGISDRDGSAEYRYYSCEEKDIVDHDGNPGKALVYILPSMIYAYYNSGHLKSIQVLSYLELLNEHKDVQILSFDKIIQAAKDELSSNPDKYGENIIKYFTVKFGYTDALDKDGNKISSIPCWKLLSEYKLGNPLTINAIDGTIIEE